MKPKFSVAPPAAFGSKKSFEQGLGRIVIAPDRCSAGIIRNFGDLPRAACIIASRWTGSYLRIQ